MLFVSLSILLSRSPAAPVHMERLGHVELGYRFALRQDGRTLWTATCGLCWAVNLVGHKLVAYADADSFLVVARSYNGRILWSVPPMGGNHFLSGGGNLLFIGVEWPIVGAIEIEKLENWPGILASEEFVAFDVDTRRVRWRSNFSESGEPVWCNGSVFVTLRFGISRAAIRRALRYGTLIPVWLEERSARSRKLLWRRRLSGMPLGFPAVRTLSGHRALLVFGKGNPHDSGRRTHTKELAALRVVVPILAGGADQQATADFCRDDP